VFFKNPKEKKVCTRLPKKKNLEHFMLPFADQLFQDADFIFQQHLAPAHTAKSTKSWLNYHDFGVLDWLANSPDLNPHRESMGYCQDENEKHETKKCR